VEAKRSLLSIAPGGREPCTHHHKRGFSRPAMRRGADYQQARSGGPLRHGPLFPGPYQSPALYALSCLKPARRARPANPPLPHMVKPGRHGQIAPAMADAPNNPIATLPIASALRSIPDGQGTREYKPSAGIVQWTTARTGRVSCESSTMGGNTDDEFSQAFRCHLPGHNPVTPRLARLQACRHLRTCHRE
jgi:hypothetical protein